MILGTVHSGNETGIKIKEKIISFTQKTVRRFLHSFMYRTASRVENSFIDSFLQPTSSTMENPFFYSCAGQHEQRKIPVFIQKTASALEDRLICSCTRQQTHYKDPSFIHVQQAITLEDPFIHTQDRKYS